MVNILNIPICYICRNLLISSARRKDNYVNAIVTDHKTFVVKENSDKRAAGEPKYHRIKHIISCQYIVDGKTYAKRFTLLQEMKEKQICSDSNQIELYYAGFNPKFACIDAKSLHCAVKHYKISSISMVLLILSLVIFIAINGK